MAVPRDPELYARVKVQLYASQPRHSAYRSMRLQQLYREAYLAAKPGGKPYVGRKPAKTTGTRRWLDEQWINVRAFVTKRKVLPCGRSESESRYPACRPLRRVNDDTPATVEDVIRRRGKAGTLRTVRAKERGRSRRQVKW